ncbi:hypothetical protein BZA77DRAFT_354206 [Pyronema omphalodes]|nr:hypothetical protein BZA77DRAFT_354206 [Pyronema omphalodes]
MLPAGIASPPAASRPPGRLRGLFHSHSSSSSSRPTNTRQRRATSPLNNATDNTWIPTISGVSGLSRVATLPAESQQSQRGSFNPSNGTNPGNTASSNINSSNNLNSGNQGQGQGNAGGTGTYSANSTAATSATSATATAPSTSIMPSATGGGGVPHAGADANTTLSPLSPAPVMPSIRFSPHLDPRSNRQSLHFTPIERLLRSPNDRIRVGRASERDSTNPLAPVGFSSKVVSRRHCEFWHENNQWFVKDVKSSSGTFLNHVRLSAPGVESKAYPINDGDILQLGIDFKGGEEQIFRCVKIRVELNKAPWGKGVNQFNMSAHKRLRNLAKPNNGKDSDVSSIHSSECSICLLSVAVRFPSTTPTSLQAGHTASPLYHYLPCQPLFVAPCSHVWHYKCIRPLIQKDYPTFLCPNCRNVADLEQEIEEEEINEAEWEQVEAEAAAGASAATNGGNLLPASELAEGRTEGRNEGGNKSTAPNAEPTSVQNSAATEETRETRRIQHSETLRNLAEHTPASPPPAVLNLDPGTPNSSVDPLSPRPAPIPSTPPQQASSGRPIWQSNAGGDSDGDNSSGFEGLEGSGRDMPDGPLTPMNDVGPFVLDGRADLAAGSRRPGLMAMQTDGRRETLVGTPGREPEES